jgi:type I restriction-modification system DNA methylase subunit
MDGGGIEFEEQFDLFEAALTASSAALRPEVFECLQKAHGGDNGLYMRLRRTADNSDESDQSDFDLTGNNLSAFSFIEQGGQFFVNGELFPALKNLPVSGQPGDRRRVVRDVFEDAYNYMKSGQLMRQVVNKINGVDFNTLTDRQHFGEIYERILNDLQSAGNAGEYYTPRAVTAFMADRIDPRPGEVLFDPASGTDGFLTCAISHMEKAYVKTPKQRETMQGALRAPWRRNSCRICSASPTCCCTASRIRASYATTTRWPAR